MKSKILIAMCTLSIMLLFTFRIFGDEAILINDPQLLEAMMQYDSNSDGQIQKSEVPDNLVLDGYKIKSVESIIEFEFDDISMKACGLTKLPEGIENINFDNLYLNDNKLADVAEIEDWLGILKYAYMGNKWMGINTYNIYLDGNPFYEDVIDYMFNDYYYNLSIIGVEGTSSWQKMELRHNLKIDDMNSKIKLDGHRTYPKVNTENSGLGEWIYEIEDASIAEIVGTKELKRPYVQDPFISHPEKVQIDEVLEIRLLKEGHTRMKISSGNYVKYTDIWVLPDGSDETRVGQYVIPFISDPGVGAYINSKYGFKEYSGIKKCNDFLASEVISIDGKYEIKDYTTFSLIENLEEIKLRNYSNELLRNIVGLGKIKKLTKVKIYATEEQLNNNTDFLESCRNIKNALGEEYRLINDIANGLILIKKIDKNHLMGDVNTDKLVNATDALLVLKHAAKLETLSDDAILVADVTQDETVDAEDALEILKYAAILIRDFN